MLRTCSSLFGPFVSCPDGGHHPRKLINRVAVCRDREPEPIRSRGMRAVGA